MPEPTPPPTVVGGGDIATALEQILRTNVPLVQELLGLDDLGEVKTWQQVPTPSALTAANLPSVVIVAPRMTTQAGRGAGSYDGVWQVSVAVFARGKDHAETQAQIQNWAKVIRVAALIPTSLGPDVPVTLRWVGEDSDLVPEKESARTLAGCEVFFDATAETVMNLAEIRNTINAVPKVTETLNTVTPSN